MELTSDDGSVLDDLDENLADSTSREYKRSLRTVMNHFNNFICKSHGIDAARYPYPVYNDEYFKEVKTTSDIFGRFANFIIDTVKIKKPKCALNYISKLRMKVESENPGTTVFNGTWYRNLRLNIMKEYVKKCARDGTKLSDQAPEMTMKDLRAISEILFRRDTSQSISHRCLLIFQWQALGRISEISSMKWADIGFRNSYIEALQVNLNRSKNNSQQDLLIFLHSSDWIACPLHALFSLIVCKVDSSNRIFDCIPPNGESKYVNSLLLSIYEEVMQSSNDLRITPNMRSHSGRSGPTTAASEHPQMQPHWLIPRGGWTLDSIQTLFSYIRCTNTTDSRVARSLSEWPNLEAGGQPPSPKGLPMEDRELFSRFAYTITSHIDISKDLREILTCVGCMYYNEVRQSYPNCSLIRVMETCDNSPGVEVLGQWSRDFRKQFIRINGPYLRRTLLQGEDLIDVTTLDQHMSDSRNAIVALSSNIAELKQAHSDEIQKLKQAHSDEIQNLKAQLNRIESLLSQRSQAPLHDTATSSIPATPVVVSNGVSVVSPWAPPEIVKVPITPIPAKCLGMITSSRSISSASVFFHWYASGLKDLNNTSLTDAQRKVFNMYRRMVHAMKHFIGPNITIPEKPSESNIQEYENWQRTIRRYAEAAVANILSIREKHKNEEYANLSGPPTKKRRRHLTKDNVATNDDFLRKKITSKNYPFSPAVDNLTPTWNTL